MKVLSKLIYSSSYMKETRLLWLNLRTVWSGIKAWDWHFNLKFTAEHTYRMCGIVSAFPDVNQATMTTLWLSFSVFKFESLKCACYVECLCRRRKKTSSSEGTDWWLWNIRPLIPNPPLERNHLTYSLMQKSQCLWYFSQTSFELFWILDRGWLPYYIDYRKAI